jgi:uncharacterized YigZ family protein
MTTLFTLRALVSARQEIKKSRFVALAAPITSEAEAQAHIAAHSTAAANHNCWAWRIGQNYRFNDDGEPSGTAGKPILQAIDGQLLDGVAVVVTRWFGGILLGSGGLMRAYGGTAALCLREAEKIPLIKTVSGTVLCTFSDLPLLQSRLTAIDGAKISDQAFGADGVSLVIAAPLDQQDQAARMVNDLTSGRVQIKWDDCRIL